MLKKIKSAGIILGLIFLFFVFFYWQGINEAAEEKGEIRNFVVAKGEGVNQISANLHSAGLLKSKFYFEIYVWQKDLENKLKAGEYRLSPAFSIKEIANILAAGEILEREATVKIIEGWSSREIDEYLKKNNIAAGNDFLNLAKEKLDNWQLNLDKPSFLTDAPANVSLEGYLFPDTYRIFKDATGEDLIIKMLLNFDRKLTAEMRQEIEKSGKSIYETVIMASLLEKEVRTLEDMRVVSGIFWQRIKNGQPLQSCATLAYVLGVNKPQYSLEDTRLDSPFNTYKHQGLPPAPICNPGLNALKAAIYPVATDYNYFLTSSLDGRTIFSKTLEEHNQNKAKYLK